MLALSSLLVFAVPSALRAFRWLTVGLAFVVIVHLLLHRLLPMPAVPDAIAVVASIRENTCPLCTWVVVSREMLMPSWPRCLPVKLLPVHAAVIALTLLGACVVVNLVLGGCLLLCADFDVRLDCCQCCSLRASEQFAAVVARLLPVAFLVCAFLVALLVAVGVVALIVSALSSGSLLAEDAVGFCLLLRNAVCFVLRSLHLVHYLHALQRKLPLSLGRLHLSRLPLFASCY